MTMSRFVWHNYSDFVYNNPFVTFRVTLTFGVVPAIRSRADWAEIRCSLPACVSPAGLTWFLSSKFVMAPLNGAPLLSSITRSIQSRGSRSVSIHPRMHSEFTR